MQNYLNLLWILHSFCTFFMTGLIWMVQVVHYPLFRFALKQDFKKYHQFHSNRISWVVFPIMTLQVITALVLFLYSWNGLSSILLGLSCFTFFITGLFFVPLHNQLARFPNNQLIDRLILLNGFRTLAWTIQSLILFSFLFSHLVLS